MGLASSVKGLLHALAYRAGRRSPREGGETQARRRRRRKDSKAGERPQNRGRDHVVRTFSSLSRATRSMRPSSLGGGRSCAV